MNSRTFLICSYRNADDAAETIQELRRTPLSDEHVGLLIRDDHDRTLFKSMQEFASDGHDTKASVTVAAGVAAGVGGGALWALGIAAGFLPAIGPVVGGGILGAILASAGSGAVAGGIVGSLIALGIDDEDAKFVSKEIDAGSTIVVVKNPADHDRTMRILDKSQASFAPSTRRPLSSKVTAA